MYTGKKEIRSSDEVKEGNKEEILKNKNKKKTPPNNQHCIIIPNSKWLPAIVNTALHVIKGKQSLRTDLQIAKNSFNASSSRKCFNILKTDYRTFQPGKKQTVSEQWPHAACTALVSC